MKKLSFFFTSALIILAVGLLGIQTAYADAVGGGAVILLSAVVAFGLIIAAIIGISFLVIRAIKNKNVSK